MTLHAVTPMRRDGHNHNVAPALEVNALTLDYGALRAVDNVSFAIERGTILCLLGASGSGKSSVLRLLAGLERPTSGQIMIDDDAVAGDGVFVEPERRRVGMVFQDFALFPHLTVKGNVAFGIRGRTRPDVDSMVGTLLTDVGLAERASSYPHMLSGGERQRVALARALAPKPQILLMDEPFSSLDARLRDQVRQQTIDLLRRSGTTTILVTHDPGEALRVADRIGVLSHGRLVQCGTATEIYRHPCSPQMAHSFGAVNTMAGAVENGALRTPLGDFRAPSSAPPGPAIVCIRPQHVGLRADGSGVRAIVTSVTCVGDATEVQLRVGDLQLVARVSDATSFAVGDDLGVLVDPSHLFVFPQRRASASAVA
jgi:iron(III) transport system ATP-binding protein